MKWWRTRASSPTSALPDIPSEGSPDTSVLIQSSTPISGVSHGAIINDKNFKRIKQNITREIIQNQDESVKV